MRRLSWLLALAILACSDDEPDSDLVEQPTRVRVSPEAFLGNVRCAKEGGMHTYRAALLDVTDGLDQAFLLPSSDVVPCTSDVEFGFVKGGRSYIAQIIGFDRADLRTQNPGSPLVVDEEGQPVAGRWSTTCWGYDGLEPPAMGGAPSDNFGGAGGAEGARSGYGVESFTNTLVTVRGCEALEDSGSPSTTGLSFDIEPALLGLTCGDGAGNVETFTITPATDDGQAPSERGGAGGGGAEPGPEPLSALCGEKLVVSDLPAGVYISFVARGFEPGNDEAIWSTTCRGLTVSGLISGASCEPSTRL